VISGKKESLEREKKQTRNSLYTEEGKHDARWWVMSKVLNRRGRRILKLVVLTFGGGKERGTA